MTKAQKYDLNDWISIHVIGWNAQDTRLNSFNPTQESKDAMDVLKKCAEQSQEDIAITKYDTEWRVGIADWNWESMRDCKTAETLELAICLFAKQLFSQTTTK